jgi:hypothetical protein
MEKKRGRILYILTRYPQLSETYIKREIEEVRQHYDLTVVSLAHETSAPYRNCYPFRVVERRQAKLSVDDEHYTQAEVRQGAPYREWFDFRISEPFSDHLLEIIEEVRPDVIHSHYAHNASLLSYLSNRTGIPFTLRAHSYETMHKDYRNALGARYMASPAIERMVPYINDDACLGMLAFPYTIDAICATGISRDKMIACYPVVNQADFSRVRGGGDNVLGVGPVLPKKAHNLFVDLAALMPEREFHLYAIGYSINELRQYARNKTDNVFIHDAAEHEDMPDIYARFGWFVYTAHPVIGNCGWPVSIFEAQAAGLGVCAPNIHPASGGQLGGGGFLYNDIRELPSRIRASYPEEMRLKGFENAKRADVQQHIQLLTDLWNKALSV